MILLLVLAFSLVLPKHLTTTHAWIPDEARFNGICILGGPGSGKSRLMGRLLAYLDFLRGIPVVILDPLGGTIDNFIHRISLLPRAQQEQLWPRVFHIDMSGQENRIQFPLHYRISATESLAAIALRFVDVVRRLDPNLSHAAMEGTNALMRIGQNVGMILAALQLPITEAPSLIAHPERWKQRFEHAKIAFPEVQPAIDYMLDFAKHKPEFRARRSESFLAKLQMFLLDPGMRAMFGASTPGLDWAQAIERRYAVLIDFRHELTEEYRRFKLLWVFMYLLSYLNARGYAGRTQPVSVLIDELTEFVNFHASDGKSVMTDDIEKLVSVISRNYGVWLTLAGQGLSQFDLRIQKMLMRMGSQIIGNTPDPEDALYLARQLIPYDPYREKKREPIWMKIDPLPILAFFGGPTYATPKIIDYRSVEFTPEEQYLMNLRRFQELEKLTFLVKLARGEGNLHAPLRVMSIASIDGGLYPDPFHMNQVRQLLSARYGPSQERLLSQRGKQTRRETTKKPLKTPEEKAKLEVSSPPAHVPPDGLPTTTPIPTPSSGVREGVKDGALWQ